MAKQNMRLAGRIGCKMRRPTSIEKRGNGTTNQV
jgi:hypothetical protein